MNKIKRSELIKAFNIVADFCSINYEVAENDEAEKVDNALDILYKQLFEEGDR